MNGIKVLLDTNFILGMLKSTPEVLAVIASRDLLADECAYSAVTRMELLGFPGIDVAEEILIRDRLSRFAYLSITPAIEDAAIDLRRRRKVKLPDALIAATALGHGLNLLTLDADLIALLASISGGPANE